VAELIDPDKLKQILEAALMAADAPLTVDHLTRLFAHGELDSEEGRAQIRNTLAVLEAETTGRGYELVRVASGYRYQVRQELSEWVSRLWDEKPPRYTRALLETLALIVYRQPVTRGDIEEVRGVAVSQNIMRTLVERGWIRVVGQREVPGKPALYGTTRAFLDYFSLKSLDQLPPLAEIRSLIEPMVIEATASVAREAAEHDHPELTAVDGGADTMDEAVAESDDKRHERQVNPTLAHGHDGQRRHAAEDGDEAADESVGEPSQRQVDERSAEAEGSGEDILHGQAAEDGQNAAEDSEVAAEDSEVAAEDSEVAAGGDEAGGRQTPTAEVVQLPLPPRR
jgi:segregation and condensation protein B